jgi:hypothetical protein
MASSDRPFESGIYEANYLTAELRDKSDTLFTRVRRMLLPFSVARRYRLNGWCRIAFRIKTGMILCAFHEGAGDSAGIL